MRGLLLRERGREGGREGRGGRAGKGRESRERGGERRERGEGGRDSPPQADRLDPPLRGTDGQTSCDSIVRPKTEFYLSTTDHVAYADNVSGLVQVRQVAAPCNGVQYDTRCAGLLR